jgi:integrase
MRVLGKTVVWGARSSYEHLYVFTTSRGEGFSKTSHYYYWHALRAAAGRPGMDFYEVRHFCATHLLELGLSL